jgi:hypothetical protein
MPLQSIENTINLASEIENLSLKGKVSIKDCMYVYFFIDWRGDYVFVDECS